MPRTRAVGELSGEGVACQCKHVVDAEEPVVGDGPVVGGRREEANLVAVEDVEHDAAEEGDAEHVDHEREAVDPDLGQPGVDLEHLLLEQRQCGRVVLDLVRGHLGGEHDSAQRQHGGHDEVDGHRGHARGREAEAAHQDQRKASWHAHDGPHLGVVAQRRDGAQQVTLKRADGNPTQRVGHKHHPHAPNSTQKHAHSNQQH
mmetsp:Transcript_10341/g.32833  ORF Transcript_10341/g.32833 Transcript_10341/m.32833 type:complete len:202 (+) Transcript_10341:367-972(+)